MKVLKFGGSSLAETDRVETVAAIVSAARREGPVCVVVSALGGVTDALHGAADAAADGDPAYIPQLEGLKERHHAAARALVPAPERADAAQSVDAAFGDLGGLIKGVSLVRECSARSLDAILSHGERLSSRIVAGALRRAGLAAEACDARGLVRTNDRFGCAQVDPETTYPQIEAHFAGNDVVQVVTGFIGATAAGETTTLGRGGSDYTASLLGAALAAVEVEIWTDVDGVMSADPRIVPWAFSIDELSYDELMELSHFGAKVIHPASVHPARSRDIPLRIRNTLNPDFPGTRVTAQAASHTGPVRGISSIHPVALLRLEGDGMVGVPGVAQRLFGALAAERISVILISQASSEHSICFAVEPGATARARERIDETFRLERGAGLVDPLVIEEDLAVVAAVGEAMRERAGVAGRLFGVLGDVDVSVRAIAQGSSELNISCLVAGVDEVKAVRAVHDGFFVPGGAGDGGGDRGDEEIPAEEEDGDRGAARTRPAVATPRLFVVGAGRVGAALLAQLARREGAAPPLSVVAVSRSAVQLADPGGIAPEGWAERLEAEGGPADLDALVRTAADTDGALWVDTSASPAVARTYGPLLDAGVTVVTANKVALAGPRSERAALDASRAGAPGASLLYETTVGAGLPVLRTCADLVATGDRIDAIEGVLSGSVAAVLAALHRGRRFSEAVRWAHGTGLTEPDPREDLSGADVVRKLVILAREAGCALEADDVVVDHLLPGEEWDQLGGDLLWEALPRLDAAYAEGVRSAEAVGARLTYLASLRLGGREPEASVRVAALPARHPCATGSADGAGDEDGGDDGGGDGDTDAAEVGTGENVVAFSTRRYGPRGLVVRGPGAGTEVAAAGVFADVLRAARRGGAA